MPYEDISPTFGQKLISCTIIRFISSFSSAHKTQEGIKRFVFLILLSPAPLLQKIRVLGNRDTRIYFLATISTYAGDILREYKVKPPIFHRGSNAVIACLFVKAKIVPNITLSAIWLTMYQFTINRSTFPLLRKFTLDTKCPLISTYHQIL